MHRNFKIFRFPYIPHVKLILKKKNIILITKGVRANMEKISENERYDDMLERVNYNRAYAFAGYGSHVHIGACQYESCTTENVL